MEINNSAGFFFLIQRITGKIAAERIFFQRDVRREDKGKIAVAGAGFYLFARQSVFLAGFRVQKDGKAFADFLKAERKHFLFRAADDDKVPVLDGLVQQFIPHGAADLIKSHFILRNFMKI